ncbi:LysM peptidoglycan-binding domain-containing protein [Flavobacterium sp. MK4S-17]|uniref:LysM peptidoglycan-binding domain-containing protein n=1 Tax=Flavobacterium sp. MK4S-17 TaxID=2543737 RepID=UPI001358763A|nr:LysM peptidoglycan-binding domain-containing protein [Flavobacterium sp. MK4S-17]
MKAKLLFTFLLILLNYAHSYSYSIMQQQQKTARAATHRVALGETVVLIAKKYMVTPHDIYELNPEAVNGLSAGMILKIPTDKSVQVSAPGSTANEHNNFALLNDRAKKAEHDTSAQDENNYVSSGTQQDNPKNSSLTTEHNKAVPLNISTAQQTEDITKDEMYANPAEVTHDVISGETLTELARKYNTTIAAITKANEKALRHGLQIGQTLTIPSGTNPSPEMLAAETGGIVHDVVSGETLTGLARKYNTTIEAITDANEKTLRRGLQIGQRIVIPAAAEGHQDSNMTENSTVLSTQSVMHKVENGETLTGLARKYNTSIEAITAENSNKLKRGLQAGQTLSITINKQ